LDIITPRGNPLNNGFNGTLMRRLDTHVDRCFAATGIGADPGDVDHDIAGDSARQFALIARTENLEARHLFDTHGVCGQAGLNLTCYSSCACPIRPRAGWRMASRTRFRVRKKVSVNVSITDDSGKIGLNTADVTVLTQMFVGNGIDPIEAEQLAAAIIDWRDRMICESFRTVPDERIQVRRLCVNRRIKLVHHGV
jgi:hypothetical protein